MHHGSRRSYHGTCFEVLHRILAKGLQTEWSVNSDGCRDLRGIWSLSPERSEFLLSYMLCTCLDRSGYMFGPMLELRSPDVDPQGRRVVLKRRCGRRNHDKWLSYEDTTTVGSCLVHIIHMAELSQARQDTGISIFAEGCLHDDSEIHSDETRGALAARSEYEAQTFL